MTDCVIGVDGGGTKTACQIASLEGDELGRATAGPSNYQTIGAEATYAVLREALVSAALGAGPLRVRGLCFALAGVDRPADRQAIDAIGRRIVGEPMPDVEWALRAGAVRIENDAVASLVGGTGRAVGVVVVAGTGSIAFGMNGKRERRRAGGWGYLLGDEGSGYSIGLAGLRAVCRAHDGRAAATRLAGLVLRQFQLENPTQLIGHAYGDWGVPQIASVAPLVFRAAEDGDPAARPIVEAAADELALAGAAVICGLELAEDAFDVVTAGGTWQGSALLRERFATGIAAAAPRASVIAPKAEPVRGAVLLALEAAGVLTL